MHDAADMVLRRTQALREAGQRGATALEWALIAAIVIVSATFIGAAVYSILQDSAGETQTCAEHGVGSNC